MMNGWLMKDGDFILCKPFQHDLIAQSNGGSELLWEKLGYVKIFDGVWHCESFLTDVQEKFLIDNGLLDKMEVMFI